MKERTLLSIKLISTHILLLPLILAIGVLTPPVSIYLDILVQTLLIIILTTGYWEFFGLKFRTYYSILIEVLIVILIIYRVHAPTYASTGWIGFVLYLLLQGYLIFNLFNICLVIFKKEKVSFEISFPLRGGKFLITDGGNSKVSRLMNYHYHSKAHKTKGTNLSMKFATDIVRLDPPLKSFLPTSNSDYSIFENQVYSPLSGEVFKVVNDIEDNTPYSGNYPYNTGNNIVIRNGDLYLLIGHLRKGSIIKKVGDKLNQGERIAAAGNSGFSERPHIHMQMMRSETNDYWSGEGVSITYRHINLYKNRIISDNR